VRERADAPLLVDDEQQRDLGERLRPPRERAQHAERQHVAALHVDGARPVELVGVGGVALHRPVVVMRDDGVEMSEEQDPAAARAGEAGDEVRRVVGAGARDVLHGRVVGQQRGGDRGGLLGAPNVARRRRDPDQRLDLALGTVGDVRGGLFDPRIQGSRTVARHGQGTARGRHRPGLRA
jgi:hypothetical protein